MDLPYLRTLTRTDLEGKKVLVRLDLNVPIQDGVIMDDFRIRKAIPTLEFLSENGAQTIVVSHIGRDKSATLSPVVEELKNVFTPTFVSDPFTPEANDALAKMQNGDLVVFENIRAHDGETANDTLFAKRLANMANLYVNDAFSVSHREHASVVGIPQFLPSYFGFQFEQEILHLELALNPPHPFLFVVGGAKIATKVPLMKKFLDIADTVFVGGALASDVFQEQGLEVGKSITDDSTSSLGDIAGATNLMLPVDVVVEDEGGLPQERKPDNVLASDTIYDAGPETISELTAKVADAKFILWNGPLGFYEKGFSKGSKDLLLLLADANAQTLLGGGDTIALISELGLEDRFTFVSTGGGAMLDFLSDHTLPGIVAVLGEKV